VPGGGPLVWCFPGGLGADRVTGMVIAVHLAVSGDGGRPGVPSCGGRADRRVPGLV